MYEPAIELLIIFGWTSSPQQHDLDIQYNQTKSHHIIYGHIHYVWFMIIDYYKPAILTRKHTVPRMFENFLQNIP